MTFDDPMMTDGLDALDAAGLDELDFGVVGRHFFFDVAPCMNNYMVAERFEETTLDVTMPYVLTFRMRPTPVRLRLIRTAASPRRWVLVSRV